MVVKLQPAAEVLVLTVLLLLSAAEPCTPRFATKCWHSTVGADFRFLKTRTCLKRSKLKPYYLSWDDVHAPFWKLYLKSFTILCEGMENLSKR